MYPLVIRGRRRKRDDRLRPCHEVVTSAWPMTRTKKLSVTTQRRILRNTVSAIWHPSARSAGHLLPACSIADKVSTSQQERLQLTFTRALTRRRLRKRLERRKEDAVDVSALIESSVPGRG